MELSDMILENNASQESQEVMLRNNPITSNTQESSFVGKVSSIPVVNAISKAYTSGKEGNRLLRVGAETVENSVKYMAAPFEPRLRNLDQYAGKQLQYLQDQLPAYTRTLQETLVKLTRAETYIDMLVGRLRSALAACGERVEGGLDLLSEAVVSRHQEARLQAVRLRDAINAEIVKTLRSVVQLIDSVGSLLPIPGQMKLREFLLSLPERLGACVSSMPTAHQGTDTDSMSKTNSSENVSFSMMDEREEATKTFLLANDSIVMIKSLANVISQYLTWSGMQMSDVQAA